MGFAFFFLVVAANFRPPKKNVLSAILSPCAPSVQVFFLVLSLVLLGEKIISKSIPWPDSCRQVRRGQNTGVTEKNASASIFFFFFLSEKECDGDEDDGDDTNQEKSRRRKKIVVFRSKKGGDKKMSQQLSASPPSSSKKPWTGAIDDILANNRCDCQRDGGYRDERKTYFFQSREGGLDNQICTFFFPFLSPPSLNLDLLIFPSKQKKLFLIIIRKWAADCAASSPTYFAEMSAGQAPKFLWIGCSDSRVPANQIMSL